VEVADDGDGFDVAGSQAAAGTGLKGMRERAVLLGAHLDIVSAPSAGTTVALRLPLHSEDDRTAPVRILLVEDHAAVGEAIASAFEREAGFAIVGHATSLREARRMLEEVDVALIDLGLPDGNGGDLIAELRAASPRAQALVLSATVDRAEVARAVERGAAGVLNKAAHLSEVVEDVRRLQRGETLLSLDEIVELLRFAGREREREQAEHLAVAQLTPREREVLQALAEGLDTAEVAARLHITVRTARNHTANILAKLGVHSQLQALVFAVRYGVVSIS
jgi:DNA-binding NarL/FixJ family response regulator